MPVNALVLWLAFRPGEKRLATRGLIAVLTGMLYAPVRFFLDFLRPEETDPRYLGLTFAQWASIARVRRGARTSRCGSFKNGDAGRDRHADLAAKRSAG